MGRSLTNFTKCEMSTCLCNDCKPPNTATNVSSSSIIFDEWHLNAIYCFFLGRVNRNKPNYVWKCYVGCKFSLAI